MTTNHLLSRLARADFQLLEPKLEAVDLPLRKRLQLQNKRVTEVYFLETGIASVVANGEKPIEVGMIGREGMTGVSTILGNDERLPHETYMQMAGNGLVLSATDLRKAVAASPGLQQVLLGFAHAFMKQVSETALANGSSKLEERLARWLLMARDRAEGDELPLTHEFLSIMLGVRRSGVTTALQELERRALIAHRRSHITILDREGLIEIAEHIYTPPERT